MTFVQLAWQADFLPMWQSWWLSYRATVAISSCAERRHESTTILKLLFFELFFLDFFRSFRNLFPRRGNPNFYWTHLLLSSPFTKWQQKGHHMATLPHAGFSEEKWSRTLHVLVQERGSSRIPGSSLCWLPPVPMRAAVIHIELALKAGSQWTPRRLSFVNTLFPKNLISLV